MISIAPDATETKFRCPLPSESNFLFELQERELVLASSSSTLVTIDDALFQRDSPALVRYDAEVVYFPTAGPVTSPYFFSGNPALATVDSSGDVTTVGSGNVDIFCRALQTTKKVTHNARTTGGSTADTFLSYIDGTLGKHSTEQGDELVSGGGELNLFSTKNSATSTYVRNASCWAASLDWSGVSPHNSTGGFQRGGTLVSPRHLVWANHFNIANGATVTFVNDSNEVFTRTVSNSVQIGFSDIRVGVLNADIDASVSFYQVLPNDWRDYIVAVFRTNIPLITTDQDQNALVRDFNNSANTGPAGIIQISHNVPAQDSPRSPFSQQIVGGDSGQPMFMLINGTMVLLGCHYTAFGIPLLSNYITEINAAMTTLGGGYQLTQADLSAFTNFAS